MAAFLQKSGTCAFDVAVIGGGPAGLMAAGRAAEIGAKVALIEKNVNPGRKLLLTGNGRCNLTNNGDDLRGFIERFGRNGKFLYHALSVFGVNETLNFFHKRGLPTKVEENGRVFPASDRAADVLNVLLDYTKKAKVFTGAPVEGIETSGDYVTGIKIDGSILRAKNYIICTGGKSFPKTGSSGEAFDWLRKMGHKIVHLEPALAPINVKEAWIRTMEGATLAGIGITILQAGRKKAVLRGDAVVTANGLSGPIILNSSRMVRGLMREGEVKLHLDLMPDKNSDELQDGLLRDMAEHPKRLVRNELASFVSPKIAGTIFMLSGIEGDRRLGSLSKKEGLKLTGFVKSLSLTVKGTPGFERAYVTSGGVALGEIDPMTMRSKIYKDLYFAGEVIDLDGESGGYNLQAAWSTGYLAGESAAKAG